MSMNNFLDMLTKEQKLALLKALQEDSITVSSVPEDVKKESISHINDSFIVDKNKTNNRRKEPVKGRKNQWVDEGEDRHIETKYGARTPRTREPSKKIDVDCAVCGKSFKTDPKYVYGDYPRCNRCTGR